ncbi:sigma-70 family RNA polymerase sigma factor [Demequina aurantiaca]|uniref:sigma-70 family RNA polymerase sigma factor n=1 Tax=Demequina aurantiaca TaxID=676200 RepID=UPI003D3537D1
MTLPAGHSTPDVDLVTEVRDGTDTADQAFAELWIRHFKAGRAVARQVTDRFDPDDLTQEAFARILSAIRRGKGPTEAFRPYLYASIRTVSIDWARSNTSAATATLDEADTLIDPESMFTDSSIDRTLTGKAFLALRPEWRTVLWYTEVEGMKPREIAVFMGIAPNAVSALGVRARDGLRNAWMQAHLNSEAAAPECRSTVDNLGAYNRGRLAPNARDQVETHLTSCLKCSILVDELDTASSRLGIMLLPLVLGPGVTALNPSPSYAPLPAKRLNPAVVGIAVAALTVVAVGAGASISLFGSADSAITTEIVASAPSTTQPAEQPEQNIAVEPANPATPVRAEPTVVERPALSAPVDTPITTQEGGESAEPTSSRAPTAGQSPPTMAIPGTDPAPASPPPTSITPTPEPEPELPPMPAIPVITTVANSGFYLPKLSGIATPGATLILFEAGTTHELTRTTVDAAGAWSLTIPSVENTEPLSVVALIEDADSSRSELTEPAGPFTLAAPDVQPDLSFSPTPAVVVVGVAGETVESIIDGVPTGNLYTLAGTPLSLWFPLNTQGTFVAGFRYVDTTAGLTGRIDTVTFVDGLVAP